MKFSLLRRLCSQSEVNSKIREAIINETQLTYSPLVPEVKLHLITPDCRLWNGRVEESPFAEPFWGFFWPGGQALARFVFDNAHVFTGHDVIDIGCGCGAAGIAAAMVKAKSVCFNDTDEDALTASKLNCDKNGIFSNICFSSQNIIGREFKNKNGIFLIGDMFYDSCFGETLLKWISKSSERGWTVFVGDPGRNENFSSHLNAFCVASYKLPSITVLENRGFYVSKVWQIRNK